MPSFKQLVAYGLILFSAITIGYDSGYLNGVLGAEDFVHRYGTSSEDGDPKYLTPYTKSLFSSLLIVGTTLGCLITPTITNKSRIFSFCPFGAGTHTEISQLAERVS
ncbi:hypothetical protein Neosp_007887 [[Neocosmospora] mangrovei]